MEVVLAVRVLASGQTCEAGDQQPRLGGTGGEVQTCSTGVPGEAAGEAEQPLPKLLGRSRRGPGLPLTNAVSRIPPSTSTALRGGRSAGTFSRIPAGQDLKSARSIRPDSTRAPQVARRRRRLSLQRRGGIPRLAVMSRDVVLMEIGEFT